MYPRIKILLLLGLILAAPLAWAQPANDNIANAILLEGSPVTIAGTTVDSTIDTSDTPGTSCGTSITTGGVWYRVFGGGGTMSAQTCGATSYDSKLSVFSGTPGALVCIVGNDDFCGLQSRVEWASAPSESYYILVHGFGSAKGTFELTVTGGGNAPSPVSDRATFRVTKDFTDGDNPTEINVNIECNTGLILSQDKVISEGDENFVNFVVTDYTAGQLTCTVTETPVPAGYSDSYQAGSAGGSAEFVSGGGSACTFERIRGGDFFCRITNAPDPIAIEITKEWVFEGSGGPQDVDTDYSLTLYCDGYVIEDGSSSCESNGLYQCKRFNGSGSEVFTATVIPQYPANNCYVEENAYSNYVETDNGCTNLVVSAGDSDIACTIVNSVFFEGIPTLGQYGKLLLVLLILGVGFVTVRRFA